MERGRFLFFLAIAALLSVHVGVQSEEQGDPKGEENIQEKLEHVANDIYETVTKSQTPVQDLQNKYTPAAKKATVGMTVGYIVGRVVQNLAINIFKVGAAALTGIVVACSVGWIGKDPSEMADEALGKATAIQNKLLRLADVNNDGKVDATDARVWWRRVEKVILKGNLAITMGAISGAGLAFFL